MSERYIPSESVVLEYYSSWKRVCDSNLSMLKKDIGRAPGVLEKHIQDGCRCVKKSEIPFIKKMADSISKELTGLLNSYAEIYGEKPTKKQMIEFRDGLADKVFGALDSDVCNLAVKKHRSHRIANMEEFLPGMKGWLIYHLSLGDDQDSLLIKNIHDDLAGYLKFGKIENKVYSLELRSNGIYCEASQETMNQYSCKPKRGTGASVVVGGIEIK
jgi:hypothetical protein